jgi:hypothetical protein
MGRGAQRCQHRAGAVALQHLAILAAGVVLDVETRSLDPPVAAAEDEQALGIGMLGRQAGDQVALLLADLTGLEHRDAGSDLRPLGEARDRTVADQGRRDAKLAALQPAVAFAHLDRVQRAGLASEAEMGVGPKGGWVCLSRSR